MDGQTTETPTQLGFKIDKKKENCFFLCFIVQHHHFYNYQ
jgi:hypothetical protein